MFLVGNDLLSESDFDPGNAPELGFRRGGVAYVCPHCGQAWAHAIVVDSKGQQMQFDVAVVSCEQHTDYWEVPGSLLSGYRNAAYLPLMSAKALKREFVVHHNKWRAE